MAIETKEITFEQEIEYSLIDHGGYIKGNPRDYNREFAIDTKQLFQVSSRQPARRMGKAVQKTRRECGNGFSEEAVS